MQDKLIELYPCATDVMEADALTKGSVLLVTRGRMQPSCTDSTSTCTLCLSAVEEESTPTCRAGTERAIEVHQSQCNQMRTSSKSFGVLFTFVK